MLNTRMITEEEYLAALKDLDIYGFTKLANILDFSHIKHLKDLILKENEDCVRSSESIEKDKNSGAKMVYNLQNKNKEFVDVLSIESIERILTKKLNDPWYQALPANMPNYILNYYNARSSIKPLALHNDSYIPNIGQMTWVMQVVYVIDDFHEHNGCTIVVPGSHQSGKYADRELPHDKCHKITAKAGDVILWDSRLWHGTLENTSKQDRWAILATFSQWWLKQSMDITRSLPESIYSALSDEQKRLLGFCSMPPFDEHDRIITKMDYSFLKKKVADYS